MTDDRRRGRPTSHLESVRWGYKIKSIRASLGLPETAKTFRALAREITKRSGVNVTYGTMYRLAQGIEPKRPELRLALGLPAYAPAAVCPIHGVVHTRKTCPQASPKKPRSHNWRRECEAWKRIALVSMCLWAVKR